jgi:hypothetical protein
MIVGGALVVGAFYGRARGLIALGVVLAIVAGTLASIDVPVRGPIGNRTYTPVAEASVHPEYRVGIGDLRLDLRNVVWTPGTRDVRVRVGIGEATVLVAPDVVVTVTGHAGIGAVRIFARSTGGFGADDQTGSATVAPSAAVVHIDGRVGIGDVHIVRAEASQ